MNEHRWIRMGGGLDGAQCAVCGTVASETAIAAGVGVPSPLGWVTGEMASALPECRQVDLDTEFGRLLAGEFDA